MILINLQEYGHPHTLLQNPSGIFTSMVQQTGKNSAVFLKNMAANVSSIFKKTFCFNNFHIEVVLVFLLYSLILEEKCPYII